MTPITLKFDFLKKVIAAGGKEGFSQWPVNGLISSIMQYKGIEICQIWPA